jgi:hypothetical protein
MHWLEIIDSAGFIANSKRQTNFVYLSVLKSRYKKAAALFLVEKCLLITSKDWFWMSIILILIFALCSVGIVAGVLIGNYIFNSPNIIKDALFG